MFLFFTPYTFFFISFYFLFLLFIFTCPNFIIFWVFMEFIMLIFMGISYTLFLNNFSSLILYFLLQTISSFSILLFYLYPSALLFSLFITINLSIFPFHFWFLNVCYRFPNFVLFLSSSFHNIPVFLIILLFNPVFNLNFILVSTVLTVLLSGFMMLSSVDFRAVIVCSSIGNNSWFFLSSLLDLFSFILFFSVYCMFIYLLISELSVFTKPLINTIVNGRLSLLYYVVFISGLPPFPVFFVNMFILFSVFINLNILVFISLFIFSSSLILVGYLYSISNYFIHVYSSQSYAVI